ncbi:MAG: VPLPA-CTERM sorting domain-containing protein [Pseudomonadota bacterium]
MTISTLGKAVAASAAALIGFANAATLIPQGDTAFVNQSIGTALNGTDPNNAFPTIGDPLLSFGPSDAPDLSAATSILGDWLDVPPNFATGSGWSATEVAAPTNWTVGTEIAMVYAFDAAEDFTNAVASIGVDNGVFVWLNGSFIGGELAPGGAPVGEYSFSLGDIGMGTHYLAVLLEDHGGATGFNLEVTADAVRDMDPIPLPAGAVLFASGLALLRRGRRS